MKSKLGVCFCVCVLLIHVKAELVLQDCAEIAINCHGFAYKFSMENCNSQPRNLRSNFFAIYIYYVICLPALTYHSNNAWNVHASARPHPWTPRRLCPCLSSPSATAARHLTEVRNRSVSKYIFVHSFHLFLKWILPRSVCSRVLAFMRFTLTHRWIIRNMVMFMTTLCTSSGSS